MFRLCSFATKRARSVRVPAKQKAMNTEEANAPIFASIIVTALSVIGILAFRRIDGMVEIEDYEDMERRGEI